MPSAPLLAFLLIFSSFFSPQQPQSGLPNTPAGKQVEEYLAAFNSGNEEAMRKFFQEHLANAPGKTTVDERTDRYVQMRQTVGSLRFLRTIRVVESGNSIIAIEAQANDNSVLQLEFTFESVPPHSLISIAVERHEPADRERPARQPMANAKEFLSAVRTLLAEKVKIDEFSGVVLIAKDGQRLFHESYGYADKERGIVNRPNTRFNLGSINKTFTKIAIYQLSSAGKLSVDDPIKKFVPEYPNKDAAEKVTIRHLLDMTSGIGDFFGEEYQAMPKEKLRTNRDFLPLFWDKPLEFPPGTRSRYSNGGYVVLGIIIEEASGMNYHDYVREKIFERAEMFDSDSFEKNAASPDIAQGYTRMRSDGTSAIRRRNDDTRPARGSAAGGGYSTAADLLKYLTAIKNGILILPDAEGGLAIAGGAPGINAAVEWDRRTGYAVIVLANYDPPAAGSVARQIRAWIPPG